MQTIQVNGKEIKYRLHQGNSIKYVTLKFLSEDELEIILPKKCTIDIEALLKKKTPLIERKHVEYISHQRKLEKVRQQKDKLLLFGKFYDTEINYEATKYDISVKDNNVRVNLPKSVRNKDLAYEYLRKWIKRQLLETLDNYLKKYKSKMNTSINKLYIKNQKTRWASYSPKHNLNFNIKLAALPKNIIEYIVIHELAHTIEPKHNIKFWYIVAKFCPDFKKKKQELARHTLLIQESKIWKKMLKT